MAVPSASGVHAPPISPSITYFRTLSPWVMSSIVTTRSIRTGAEGWTETSGPRPDVLAEGFEPDILGLFTGSPHGTELARDQPMPPEILLYLENLWDLAEGDPAVFREETRLTYLHELGHYLGWDEDELAARGLD